MAVPCNRPAPDQASRSGSAPGPARRTRHRSPANALMLGIVQQRRSPRPWSATILENRSLDVDPREGGVHVGDRELRWCPAPPLRRCSPAPSRERPVATWVRNGNGPPISTLGLRRRGQLASAAGSPRPDPAGQPVWHATDRQRDQQPTRTSTTDQRRPSAGADRAGSVGARSTWSAVRSASRVGGHRSPMPSIDSMPTVSPGRSAHGPHGRQHAGHEGDPIQRVVPDGQGLALGRRTAPPGGRPARAAGRRARGCRPPAAPRAPGSSCTVASGGEPRPAGRSGGADPAGGGGGGSGRGVGLVGMVQLDDLDALVEARPPARRSASSAPHRWRSSRRR